MDNVLRIFSKNIVLVGFMGTGKTSVGKILARKLNREVFDVDALIEENEGRKIADIFEEDGEARFRQIEKEAIKKIAENENVVITTGGGAALEAENMQVLRAKGWIVALTASPETIYNRVRNSRHRPLLKSPNMFLEIKRLLAERKKFYEVADYSFETDRKTPSQVADGILMTLEANLEGAL